MREKFTITPEDEKYMASIGKGDADSRPLIREPKLIRKAKSKTQGLINKIKGSTGAVGRSHYSGKKYRYD